MDAVAALLLQMEWGADKALEDDSVDRCVAPAAAPPAQRTGPQSPLRVAPVAIPAVALAEAAARKATSLDELHEAIAGFEHCALRATAGHTIFFSGAPTARLIVMADAPDADDDRSGEAFSSQTGQLLDRILQSIGYSRADILIAFAVPWRPPGNRPLTKTEIDLCAPFVQRLFQLAKPEAIILLGAVAARSVLQTEETIRRLRGRWRAIDVPILDTPVEALATHHPSMLLATPALKREAWSDWLMVREKFPPAAMDDSHG